MARPDTFATIRRARALRERHPDAPPSVCAVALLLGTYADGRTGAMIRPGFARVAEETGLHVDTVRDAIRWLEAKGELRRDKEGHRGSAACFTYLGVAGDVAPEATASPEAPPGANVCECGRPTAGPYFHVCDKCMAAEERERKKREAKLRRSGDDAEARRARTTG